MALLPGPLEDNEDATRDKRRKEDSNDSVTQQKHAEDNACHSGQNTREHSNSKAKVLIRRIKMVSDITTLNETENEESKDNGEENERHEVISFESVGRKLLLRSDVSSMA
jgi:hypothetical protein